jgi:anaerobic magnesium-protoporphyrin IX monomethyl ester cyclase
MKVLFTVLPGPCDLGTWKNNPWQLSRIAPIGVIGLMSYLNAKGHQVKLADCREIIFMNKTDNYIGILLKIIEDYRPDFIGINILTTSFNKSQLLIHEIKVKHPEIFVLAGGPHPSVEPALTFEYIPDLDAICIGPGEETMLDLLEGKIPSEIPGLMCREVQDKFKPRPPEMDIDRYPFPNYSLVNAKYYSDWSAGTTTFGWLTRSLGALSTRSCAYSCKFCASDWSKPLRIHSADYVMELVKFLSRFDINTIAFWDDSIGCDRTRLNQILELFEKSGLFIPRGRLRWRASLRAPQVTSDLLKRMKGAGCFHVAIGIESGSNRILKLLRKGSNVERNREAVFAIKEAGLDPGLSFMVGVPTETEEDVNATFTFIKEMQVNSMGCGSFRPLPGSPFYREFVAQGKIDPRKVDWENLGDFSTLPKYNFSAISDQRLVDLLQEGQRLAYNDKYVAVNYDLAKKHKKFINVVSQNTRIKFFHFENNREIAKPVHVTPINRVLDFSKNAWIYFRRSCKSTAKWLMGH